jgi:hypothetical protein
MHRLAIGEMRVPSAGLRPLHATVATPKGTALDHQPGVVGHRRAETANEATQLHARLRRQRIPDGSVEGFK